MQNEAGQRLIEFCQENALVIANTLFQQQKRRLYTWTSLDGQHRNETDYILCSQRWRNSIQSAKARPGADWGSDHKLLIALEGRQTENHNHRKLIKLITWTRALSNSMKLWAMPCRATQDGLAMMESSDKLCSTGEGNGKLLQHSCFDNPMNSV